MTIEELGAAVRPPKGVSAACIVSPDGSIEIEGPEDGLFEAGSLTKTMTATLLAVLVREGTISLETTVGEVLGENAGNAGQVSLREVATHTAGLPRLALNAGKLPFSPRDPYKRYGSDRLYEGLASTELEERGPISYSNFGYQVLGHCLATAAGGPFNELLETKVLRPAGMTAARCQPCSSDGLVERHGPHKLLGGKRWHTLVPGSGGVDCSAGDLAAWARANLVPDSTELEPAILLAQQVHATHEERSIGLAWHHGPISIWHNGATGSFQSMLMLVPGRLAVGALASYGPGGDYSVDDAVVGYVRDQTK